MPTEQSAKFPAGKIAEKRLKLRESLWPKISGLLWVRTVRKGFTTIPRTMPLIMQIMNDMSKGKPVSSTYLELWCRAHDEGIVTLGKNEEIAFHSGFAGQRQVSTWRERLRILKSLRFIDTKAGPSGELSYVLILNPYLVIKKHKILKTPGLTEQMYNPLQQRAIEIGADDLE